MNALARTRDKPGAQITRVLHDSTFYLLGNVASRILGFVAIPFYSHFLSPAQYGVIELIELSTQMVALTFGLQSIGAVLGRLFHDQDSPEKEASIVSTSIISTALLSAFIAAGGILTAGMLSQAVFHTPERTSLLQAAFVAMWFANMVEVVLVYQRIRQRAKFFFYYSICTLIINFGLNVYFIGFAGAGVWGFVYSKLIVTGLGSAFLLFRVLREVGYHWQNAYIPQFVRLGLPLLAASVSAFIIHFSDRFFLADAVSLAELGRYALAYRFAFLVSIFVGEAFNRSWGVTLYRFAKQDGWRERFARVAAYLLFALYLTGLAVALAAPELFSLMVPKSFYPPNLLLPLLIAAYLFRETGDFFRSLLLINKRAKTVGSVAFAGAVLNTVLNFALIPAFGIFGAAFATLGTWAAYMLVCWVIAWREHRVPVSVLAFAKINLLAVLVFAIGDFLRLDNPLAQAFADVFWILVFIALCLWFFFAPKDRTELVSAIEAQVWRLISARPQPFYSIDSGLPTVIMISYCFPLENALSAARSYRFSKYLSRLGFRLSVVSQRRHNSENDSPAFASQAANVPGVDYPRTAGRPAENGSATVSQIEVPNPQDACGPKHFTSRLLGLFNRYFLPPSDRLPWVPHGYSAASAILGANPNHILFSSQPPVANLLVSLALKLRHGSRWIVDFCDPIAMGPVRVSRSVVLIDAIIERLVLRHADIVIANTDAMKQLWEKRYPQWQHKIRLIWNGFDREETIMPRPNSVRTRRTLTHIGTDYGGRMPWPLIESLDRLINDGKIAPDSFQLRLLGPIQSEYLDSSLSPYPRLMELGCLHVDEGTASKAASIEEMLDADYLVVFDITGNDHSGTQLPAKIFDYIRACRPILAFTSHNSALSRILAASNIPFTCVVPNATGAEIDIGVQALLALPRTGIEPGEAFWRDFDAASQTYILANMISRLTAGIGSIDHVRTAETTAGL